MNKFIRDVFYIPLSVFFLSFCRFKLLSNGLSFEFKGLLSIFLIITWQLWKSNPLLDFVALLTVAVSAAACGMTFLR